MPFVPIFIVFSWGHLFILLSPVFITGVRDPMSSIYSLKKRQLPQLFQNADHSLHNYFAFALISQAWTLHHIVHQFLGISLSVNRGQIAFFISSILLFFRCTSTLMATTRRFIRALMRQRLDLDRLRVLPRTSQQSLASPNTEMLGHILYNIQLP